jgi:hypothetical protein
MRFFLCISFINKGLVFSEPLINTWKRKAVEITKLRGCYLLTHNLIFFFGGEFKLIFMVFIYGQWVGVIKFDMASFGDDFENLKNKDK